MIKANTFSICAVNPETGEAGVAVASCCRSVGAYVPYARAGVGAVATQAFIQTELGPAALDLMAEGMSAGEAIEKLMAADRTAVNPDHRFNRQFKDEGMTEEGVDFTRDPANNKIVWNTSRIRQLGAVDAKGNAKVHNGEKISSWSGSKTGLGFCCQGNLLTGESVITAMAETFVKERDRSDNLVKPLFAALKAGEAAGGDKRGKIGTGILVTRDQEHWSGCDRYCDLRVDSHSEPVKELERVLRQEKMI